MARLIFVLALLLAPAALAHGWVQNEAGEIVPHHHDTNCPPDCTPGTPEHDVWWCSNKTVQSDCEAKDQVNCEWVGNLCKPKQGN